MTEIQTAILTARKHERFMRVGLTLACGIALALLASLIFLGVGVFRLLDRQDALATALDASRAQTQALGAEPVVPPSDVVIENPDSVQRSQPVSSEALEMATMAAVQEVVPREVSGQIGAAVSEYVRGCVASGDCVGPAGATGPAGADGTDGADGRSPGPGDVAAAVLAVCAVELDCEATPDEVAAAVAAYCSQETLPCGDRWTERQIYAIANRATVDYLSGRPIWCPAENEVPNDQPFGPCYVSSG
jgi:hypothetical protein